MHLLNTNKDKGMRDHNHHQPALRWARKAALPALIWMCAIAPSAGAATALEDLDAHVLPFVVEIFADQSWGSGFVLNQEGDVATNEHVVRGNRRIKVRQGKYVVDAILQWSSEDLDLAVFRTCKNLPGVRVATLAVSSPDDNADERVKAVGFPAVSDRREFDGRIRISTQTPGGISRHLNWDHWDDKRKGQALLMIQHTAGISAGNSGGPLVDYCGRVIGVNTQSVNPRPVYDDEDKDKVKDVEAEEDTQWASFIGELARQLDKLGITYTSTLEQCDMSNVLDTSEEARLFVYTYPYHANVQVSRDSGREIVGDGKRWQLLGAELPPGEYQVNVQAEGFREKSFLVSHGETTTTVHTALDASPASFTVETMPEEAQIEVKDVCRSYHPGMEIPFGTYEVEVSMPGFVTKLDTVTHGPSSTVHKVKLKGLKQPFTIKPVPEDAKVRLLGHGERYKPRMELEPGLYRVEVSAKRKQWSETVVHGGDLDEDDELAPNGEPTERRVALRFSDCPECPEMVVVPEGSFFMGSSDSEEHRSGDEGPVHPVTFRKPFAVGIYEVTFAQWDACVTDGGCRHRPRQETYFPEGEHWGQGQMPVVHVGWHHMQEYIKWLRKKTNWEYRLLSESEWEYVARAGTTTPFHTGDDIGPAQFDEDGQHVLGSGQANYNSDTTVEVGSFDANKWGTHDFHGNVWEWTQDCYFENYEGAPDNGSARESSDCGYGVVRGGSWRNIPLKSNYPSELRSASRAKQLRAGGGNKWVGFRVARDF